MLDAGSTQARICHPLSCFKRLNSAAINITNHAVLTTSDDKKIPSIAAEATAFLRMSRFSGVPRFVRFLMPHSHPKAPKIIPQTSPIHRLPQEILLAIFHELSSSMYHQALSYITRCPAIWFKRNIVTEPDPYQLALANMVLTCKTWCSIGMEPLYTTVFLISHERIMLFRRTLRRKPALASLVKHLYVLDPGPLPDHDSDGQPTRIPYAKRRALEKAKKSARIELLAILAECGCVDSLFLSNRDIASPVFLPLDQVFIQQSWIASHLRTLTLYGSILPGSFKPHFLPDDISLPVLETLCLREAHFRPDYRLPAFPKLRTLQIAQSTRLSALSPLVIDPEQLPSLRMLGLYENYFACEIHPDSLRRFQRLHILLGYGEGGIFPTWGPESRLDHVQHLVFGLYKITPGVFQILKSPPCLETITFVLTFQVKHSEVPQTTPNIFLNVLDDINRYMVGATMGCKRFRSIEIIQKPSETAEFSDYNLALEETRAVCKARGIAFIVREYGEYLSVASARHILSKFAQISMIGSRHNLGLIGQLVQLLRTFDPQRISAAAS